MEQAFEPLQTLIRFLTLQTKAHICIHDVSGILRQSLHLDFRNQIHSKDFCSAAKQSEKGYRTCLRCKMTANQKAIDTKKLFCGYCPYGLFEIAKPVVIDDKVQCIIYIGNLVLDKDFSIRKIQRTCGYTNSPKEKLLRLLKEAQPISSPEEYIPLAELVGSYIRMVCQLEKVSVEETKPELHWAVSTIKQYMEANFRQNITLQSVSKLYFINHKYLGRLFKRQTGRTFHEYLNEIRLKNAVSLLLETNKNILTAAMDSGFRNVTYFNRQFSNRYHQSPTQFVRDKKGGRHETDFT